MKNNKVVRKVLNNIFWIVYWISVGMLITPLLLGKNNVLIDIALSLNLLYIVFMAMLYIIRRLDYMSILDQYRDVYKKFKEIHGRRYQAYLNGNKEEINKTSEFIKEGADALVTAGKILKDNSRATKKEKKEIEEIMNKAQAMINSIMPIA